MSEMRQVDSERLRLEREIQLLRSQAQAAAEQYRQELRRLREANEASMREANEQLQRNHRQELDAMSAAYNAQRAQLTQRIQELQDRISRRMEADRREVMNRIRSLEDTLDANLQRDRAVADQYRQRMHGEWERLLDKEELRPFVDVHVATLEQADASADEAYQLSQFQAVTAIMVNSSALIDCWEKEAQALFEEWRALDELCQDVMSCMRSAMQAAADRSVDCDGKVNRVDLQRYDEEGFSRAREVMASDEARLTQAQRLSIEEMRSLLHAMERDQRFVDGVIDHAVMLHKACVRRLRCHRAITRGLKARHFEEKKSCYRDGNVLQGIQILYVDSYQGHKVLVTITTPRPETGQTHVDVTLQPGKAVDEMLEYAMCQDVTRYTRLLVGRQTYAPRSTQLGNAFRNQDGRFQGSVLMQY